jgi:hypothetical protein
MTRDASSLLPQLMGSRQPKLFQYQSSLLKVWAGTAAKLFRYQSSLLRLWADSAPGPWFQYQSSLLRLWADNCELVGRNYENSFGVFSSAIEQQRFGTSLKNISPSKDKVRPPAQDDSEQHGDPLGQGGGSLSSEQIEQDNKPIIKMTDLAAEAAAKVSETPLTVAADHVAQHVDGAKKLSGATGKRTAKSASKRPPKRARAVKKAASTKKIPRKTMKSRTASK